MNQQPKMRSDFEVFDGVGQIGKTRHNLRTNGYLKEAATTGWLSARYPSAGGGRFGIGDLDHRSRNRRDILLRGRIW
jgi:hypothetical protein